MNVPMTPPELLAKRKKAGWKPDNQGRLLFRPRGLYGSAYVVETAEQLERIEQFERIRPMLLVVVGGAAVGAAFLMQGDVSDATAIGAVATVLVIAGAVIGYLFVGGSKIVTRCAMRPRS